VWRALDAGTLHMSHTHVRMTDRACCCSVRLNALRARRTAAGFLQEGSLDTRTYGKRLLWAVKAVLRGNRPDMDRLMSGTVGWRVASHVGWRQWCCAECTAPGW
jgi:hypothetical protein